MTEVYAFSGSLVNPDKANEIVAPAYDSMSAEERAEYADARPNNFLNVMRTREDYVENVCVEQILEQNKKNLESLLAQGSFIQQDNPGFVIYRLISSGHQQTGLVDHAARVVQVVHPEGEVSILSRGCHSRLPSFHGVGFKND